MKLVINIKNNLEEIIMSEKYREAGVDLEAGYESVRLIKSHVARTKVLGAVDSIGAISPVLLNI